MLHPIRQSRKTLIQNHWNQFHPNLFWWGNQILQYSLYRFVFNCFYSPIPHKGSAKCQRQILIVVFNAKVINGGLTGKGQMDQCSQSKVPTSVHRNRLSQWSQNRYSIQTRIYLPQLFNEIDISVITKFFLPFLKYLKFCLIVMLKSHNLLSPNLSYLLEQIILLFATE